jgi:uncharacterized protein YndB with AHSA1/START domain
MTTRAKDAVEIERRVAARPEIVFAYFTDAAKYERWQGNHATLDPVPGGRFEVTVSGQTKTVAKGVYVEVDPPRRVVFTWGWVQADWLPDGMRVPPGSTTVEVTLVPDGDGTILRLRHGGLPSAAVRQFHTWGWDLSLDRLVLASEGSDPGPDPFAEM